jgi:hypothetical protein
MRRALFTIAAPVLLLSRAAAADSEAKPREYVVKPGDDCTTIAAAAYGDRKRYDLVHKLNPQLGPVPHHLKPGQVLLLPAIPPDATLTRVRNTVEVRAPEPRAGKPNDPLFRGNRVGTQASSAAELTFRDDTQVKLGENTLVVIFGDTQARAARLNAAETTLVRGNLRARLSEIAGKKPDKPRIETASGAVVMKNGEAKVSVDDKQATRLAVYEGGSTVTAQKRTVPVDDGFGSKAEMGRAPTPPKPLPAAPVWSAAPASLVLTGDEQAVINGTYAAGHGSGDAPAEWHVQLARDTTFDDVVVDVNVPVAVLGLQAQKVPPGTYAVRVSAIDADAFEGKWSAVATFAVSRLALLPLPHRRARVEADDTALACTLDGGPVQVFPIELGRSSPHSLSCTRDGATATYAVDALPINVVHAKADMLWQKNHAGTLRVRLTDENGEPLDRLDVALAEQRPGIEVGEFRRFDAAGVYIAPITWKPGAGRETFAIRVAGAHLAETSPVTLEEPVLPPAKDETRAELSAGAGAAARTGSQPGFTGFVGIGVAVPMGSGVGFLSVRGLAERYPVSSTDAKLPAGATEEPKLGVTMLGASLPIGYRFGRQASPVVPYVLVAPQIARQSVDGGATTATALAVGGYGALGLDVLTGPGAFFLEGGFRAAALVDAERPSVPASALMLGLGYRLGL